MQETGSDSPEDPGSSAADGRADEIKRLRAELARLRLKFEQSSDKDIRAVLKMRIEQITSELPTQPASKGAPSPSAPGVDQPQGAADAPADEEEEADAPPAQLTAEQLQEIDRLIRQARVEKMRNNAVEATRVLQQAATLAPASAPVLEALGDNLMERRQLAPAIKAYKKARRLAPKNVGLEEKLANAVLRADTSGSVEEQLRKGMHDSPFLTHDDIVARTPYAVLLSAICPGAGHLALGKTSSGIALLGTWIVCWIWLLIKHQDVENLAKSIAGRGAHGDVGIFIPLLVMAVCWMGALASLKPRSANTGRRQVDHPVPPANLPFE